MRRPLLTALALCAATAATAATAQDRFRDLPLDPATATADSAIATLLPYMTGHPETPEGRPGLSLVMSGNGGTLDVTLKLTGYLDDAVMGAVYRGQIAQDPDGRWTLTRIATRPICARGAPNADGLCP